ncbi:MAG: hypothetical protein IPM35_03560 [Myxococcales bacterium]|nr:hypothetical protein [Myxococcales bacterium]
MRHWLKSGVLGAAAVILLGVSCQAFKRPPEPATPVQRSDVANVAAGDRAFAFRLFRVLRERPDSFAFSPAGVRMALTMAWAGAESETAEELGSVLGLAGDPTAIHQSNQALLAVWRKAPLGGSAASFKLRVAQGFFAQTERQPAQAFIELLQRHYAAPFSPKDFAAPETVRSQVNLWVEKRTDERLGNFLPQGSLDSGLELVLVSAVDFEAPWAKPFDPGHTHGGEFQLPGGKKTAKVELLARTGEHLVNETPEAQVVELDYEGDGFVFDLIVPRGELAAFEAGFDEKKLDHLLSALAPKELTVSLPRFEAGETVELTGALQKIGIHAALTPGKADFSTITGTRKLHLSKLPHRIQLRVDEGATAERSGDAGAGKAPELRGVEVRAVRPFLYLVRDKKRNLILGMGRYAGPPGG